MQIIWYGQSCFQITAQKGKNNLVNIIIDPFDETMVGLRLPKLIADILLITHNYSNYNSIKAISGNPFIIDSPGEYEIREVFIHGIDSYSSSLSDKKRELNTIYIIQAEDLRICHLGNLNQKELTIEQVEEIGNIDILFIPIGGLNTISAKEAKEIINQIEPKIVIPMHYKIDKLKIKLDGLDKFINIKTVETLNKLSIKKRDIFEGETRTIVLKP